MNVEIVEQTEVKPIVLSSNYWKQLEELVASGTMPQRLADMLRQLLGAFFLFENYDQDAEHRFPAVTGDLLELAKKHLDGGILISRAMGEEYYRVMISFDEELDLPDDRFFFLVRQLKRKGLLKLEDA